MKVFSIILLFGLGAEISTVWAQQPSATTPVADPTIVSKNGPEPRIQFATPVYDFGRVKEGEVLKYDFIFTNAGQAWLELTDVHPGCGCTAAGSWSRKVEPGKTGNIPIQFNTTGYSGPVAKGITVTCNDKSQPTVALQIKGTVWKPVDAIPQYAIFNVTADSWSSATSVVRIVNNEELPLTLFAPESNNKIFAAELRTNSAGKEFELIIKVASSFDTVNAQGLVTLKTSSAKVPVISISTVAILQPTLVATPPTINLPAIPITNKFPVEVFIRNNGTSPLKLAEPEVNAKGVDIRMKELESGRYFSVTSIFPPGFTIANGEIVELSVKTDRSQIPTLKVPVLQSPSSAPANVPLK